MYFSVETYYFQMVPLDCRDSSPIVKFTVYQGLQSLGTKWYYDTYHVPFLVDKLTYTPYTKFRVEVQYTWNDSPAKDYTVKVYFKFDDIELIDSARDSHQVFMDGRPESGFTSLVESQ